MTLHTPAVYSTSFMLLTLSLIAFRSIQNLLKQEISKVCQSSHYMTNDMVSRYLLWKCIFSPPPITLSYTHPDSIPFSSMPQKRKKTIRLLMGYVHTLDTFLFYNTLIYRCLRIVLKTLCYTINCELFLYLFWKI